MRKLYILLMSVFLLSSCSQEVEHPIADFSLPVVHCLLNADDSIHYLRLGKTFSGTDPYEMMNNPDSLYFRKANVYFDIIVEDHIIETIKLELTDSLERDLGKFPATPFRLYKTYYPIKPGKIRLRIELPEENRYVVGFIDVRGKPYFYKPEPGLKKFLDFYESEVVRISWNGYKNSIETIIRLWYLEHTETGIDTCNLDWLRLDSTFILDPNEWFDYMLYGIKDNYRVKARTLLQVDFLASSGNKQWNDYLEQQDFVFDLIGEPWSNVTGAYGFVGSRTSGGIYGYMVDREFLDSLANLPRLESLKFVYY